MDIDNKLNHCVKTAGIINNMFRPHKTFKKTRIKLYKTLALPAMLNGSENWNITATIKNNNSSRDEIYEKKEQNTLGQIIKQIMRLQKNSSFGQNTGIQKKLVATCKQNAP
jgi:hypothetical protein